MERRLAAILAADMAGYSRLMEHDEESVLARYKSHRRDLFDPKIASHGGRIIKTTGDGMLVEFASAQDAVRCAVDIQVVVSDREGTTPEDSWIVYRFGVNLGDVIFDDGDVFGDGVNVASRLEGLAKPGGVCISDIVHQAVAERIQLPFQDMGNQRVKNISRPIRVWATVGEGTPVLKAPNWLNHLEYEWRSPIWHPWLTRLAQVCRLVRFDQRGNGLSDWDVETVSADAMASDIASVATAAGLSRFALLGISQGCSFSVRYAVEHPEQVTCLILLGGFLRGRLKRTQPDQKHLYEVGTMMIRDGWGSTNPVFRHFFTTTFMPDAQPEIAASFDELQRIATSPESAMRLWKMNSEVDATELAKLVNVPTLVLHCVGDRVAPIEEGRLMATLIPNAVFVELPGNNHVLIEGTPAFEQFFAQYSGFLAKHNS